MQRVGVGIDFGTTNSLAALFDGERVQLVALERGHAIMPSATYIDRRLRSLTGREAVARYIAGNVGRRVELAPEVIGEATLALGGDAGGREAPQTLTRKVYGEPSIDASLQGRLFQGVKRLLGDARMLRLMVFGQPFRLVALITPILLRIASEVEKKAGTAGAACFGHPVRFEGRGEHRGALALARLEEAYRHAGVADCRPFPEPIAAAVSYLHAHPGASGERLLTVDFGGGTLDLCVLERRAATDFRVLATHGAALGGDHIDRRLFEALLFPLLGKGERWRRRGAAREIETAFPFEQYEALLLNWPVAYLLNQNRYTAPVQACADLGGAAGVKFRRLRELIQQNCGYLAFDAIKQLKAQLSTAPQARLDIPEIDVDLRVERAEFERHIAAELQRFCRAVDATVAQAGCAHGDIGLVLRTGGSSLIPAVRRALDERFPGCVVEHDPFASVAAGLAIAHFQCIAPAAA